MHGLFGSFVRFLCRTEGLVPARQISLSGMFVETCMTAHPMFQALLSFMFAISFVYLLLLALLLLTLRVCMYVSLGYMSGLCLLF